MDAARETDLGFFEVVHGGAMVGLNPKLLFGSPLCSEASTR